MKIDRKEKPKFDMKAHPAAALFPMMSEAELVELTADIAKNGQLEPIIVLCAEGKAGPGGSEPYDEYEARLKELPVLDGRNRLEACRRAGVEPKLNDLFVADPYSYVISANLARRHLSPSQRAMIAARLATLPRGANQHSSRELPSQEKAAEMTGAAVASVKRARQVIDHGVPELAAAVDAGAVPVKVAAAVAELPKKEQKELVAKGPTAVRQKAKKTKAKKAEAAELPSYPNRGRLGTSMVWTRLPTAPLPTEEQWKVLRVALFKFIDLAAQRATGSKSSFALALHDVQQLLSDVALGGPAQPPLFPDKGAPVTTHMAQARTVNIKAPATKTETETETDNAPWRLEVLHRAPTLHGDMLRIYRDGKRRLGVHIDDLESSCGNMMLWKALDYFYVVQDNELAVTLASLIPWLEKGGEPDVRKLDRRHSDPVLIALRNAGVMCRGQGPSQRRSASVGDDSATTTAPAPAPAPRWISPSNGQAELAPEATLEGSPVR